MKHWKYWKGAGVAAVDSLTSQWMWQWQVFIFRRKGKITSILHRASLPPLYPAVLPLWPRHFGTSPSRVRNRHLNSAWSEALPRREKKDKERKSPEPSCEFWWLYPSLTNNRGDVIVFLDFFSEFSNISRFSETMKIRLSLDLLHTWTVLRVLPVFKTIIFKIFQAYLCFCIDFRTESKRH